jgi:Domain of unknown function (DUF4185)
MTSLRSQLVCAVVLVASLPMLPRTGATAATQPHLAVTTTVSIVSKIIGGTGMGPEPRGLPILNAGVGDVDGADLGAITLYRHRWYLALGDANYDLPLDGSNFLIGTAPFTPNLSGKGIRLTGYLADSSLKFGLRAPARALRPDPGSTIPGSLFTLRWQGRETMIAQYMVGGDFGGHDHWSQASQIAVYDDRARIFRPYKPSVYRWQRSDAVSSDATRLQYNFGQSSFWLDARNGYLYMLGAPTNRFGGVKLARIPVSAFLDPQNLQPWSYYLGQNQWSAPTADETQIDAQVPWLIPPRDPGFSLDKNYNTSGQDQCAALAIAEFSLVWDPYLHSFVLLTASAACKPDVLRMYTAPNLTGPWSAPQDIAMPYTHTRTDWDYYAPYTTDSLLQDGGKTVYVLASTYSHYGVYLYRINFNQPASSIAPSHRRQATGDRRQATVVCLFCRLGRAPLSPKSTMER